MDQYIPIIGDVEFDYEFTWNQVESERNFQKEFAAKRFESSCVRKNKFASSCVEKKRFRLLSAGKEKESGQSVAMVQLLFKISVRRSNKTRKYPFLQQIDVMRPIDTSEETFLCVF